VRKVKHPIRKAEPRHRHKLEGNCKKSSDMGRGGRKRSTLPKNLVREKGEPETKGPTVWNASGPRR